jgi:hypothetical protein
MHFVKQHWVLIAVAVFVYYIFFTKSGASFAESFKAGSPIQVNAPIL